MSLLNQSKQRTPAHRHRRAVGERDYGSSRVLFGWLFVIGSVVTIQALQGLQAVQILVLALIAFTTAALPLAAGVRVPVHHPSVVALGLLGMFTLPKAAWIALNGTDVRQVQFDVLRGHATVSLIWGLLALSAGYLAYSLGVMFTHKAFPVPRWRLFTRASSPSWSRSVPILLGVFSVTAAAMVLFVAATGFDFAPRKRFAGVSGGSSARVGTVAYLWFRIALLSRLGLVAALFWRFQAQLQGRDRLSRTLLYLAIGNGIVAAATPYLADNRAGVVLVLLDVIVINAALGQSRRRWIPLFAGAGVGIAVSASLLSARLGQSGSASAIESFVLTRDLADFSKVGVIIESGYQTSGNSFWHWMLTPLPASYWPVENEWIGAADKIWSQAYGLSGPNSIPPSLPGELFAAFSWIGVALGMFFFGIVAKKLYRTAQNQLTLRSAGSMVVLILLLRYTVFGLSADFGTGMVKGLLDAAPLAVFLAIGERPARRHAERPHV